MDRAGLPMYCGPELAKMIAWALMQVEGLSMAPVRSGGVQPSTLKSGTERLYSRGLHAILARSPSGV